MLRKAVMERASSKWDDLPANPVHVPRVLDVVKSKLCWILGTIYIEMPLKPNVLEDLGRDYSVPPPPPREKFYSNEDNMMLEDESGRIKLVGERLASTRLVTGVIIAVLGMETAAGDFEAVDICYPDLAPFAKTDALNDKNMDADGRPFLRDEYLAVVSGLSIGGTPSADAHIQMLVEYLSGETGGVDDQTLASQITRLIIAGNSLCQIYEENDEEENRPRKGNSAPQPNFSTNPNVVLSAYLYDLASTLPVHILPGANDPAGVILPQQPFPRAMLGKAANFETFRCETNPVWLRIECGGGSDHTVSNGTSPSSSRNGRIPLIRSILATSGQSVLDMYQYLPTPPSTHLSIACSTLKWRHIAPTAPDTLWCHPFREKDPFVFEETPDLYIVGGMPEFDTELIGTGGKMARKCRVVLVPSFSETGCLVLVNLRTLAARCVKFSIAGGTEILGDHNSSARKHSIDE